ncbi:phage capsid protein [Zavarzinia aquatilis]|uniref:Phage major capsid protein n=1 Tax=Zavarzinia aquatilis TaxID=2211142 RepID=A0A317EDI0_9PROT|nr:phage capsid protein [Zavarzinia aquatilis]PWR24979.1 hypothetical protein DKG74_04210 [Zavarzinia aquatilis]
MSDIIPAHLAPTFNTALELLLQQRGSLLRAYVQPGNQMGEGAQYINQIGKADPAEKNAPRLSATPNMNVPGTARWVYPNTFDWGTLIDKRDKLFQITDPQSGYLEAASLEMGRQIDGEIIRAVFDVARTGKNGATTVPFPAGNVVGKDVGGTASGLNVAKLRAAKKLLLKNFVNINEKPILVVTAEQHDNLLADPQINSKDYNERPVLVDGQISQFMGFQFVHCELSALPDGDTWTLSGNDRKCPFWVPSGVHLNAWQEVQTKIDQRPDLKYATQLYTDMVLGGSRCEEGKVGAITCVEP